MENRGTCIVRPETLVSGVNTLVNILLKRVLFHTNEMVFIHSTGPKILSKELLKENHISRKRKIWIENKQTDPPPSTT